MFGGTNFAMSGGIGAPTDAPSAGAGGRRRVGMATAALVILPAAMVGLLSGSGRRLDGWQGVELQRNRDLRALWHHRRSQWIALVRELRQRLHRRGFDDRESSATSRTPAISQPVDITAGPNGALWFTNYGNSSIGEITTAGVVSNFTDAIDQPSDRHHHGTRWCTVVCQSRQRLHRADHDAGVGLQLHGRQHCESLRHHVGSERRAVVHQPEPVGTSFDRRDLDRREREQLHRSSAHQPLRHRGGRQLPVDHESSGRRGRRRRH